MMSLPHVSKAVISLVNEIQRLMFTSDTPVPVSEDITKFMFVMSAFNNYEKSVRSNHTHHYHVIQHTHLLLY